MDRLFDEVFVRPPGKRYPDCVSTNPERVSIDLGAAKNQHREMVSLFKGVGIRVTELSALDDFPDSVFMQDQGILGSSHSVIGRFGEKSRRGETKVFVSELNSSYRGKTGTISLVRAPGALEGGDIMVTPSALYVGQSERSNLEGIRQLSEKVRGTRVVPVKVSLMHLLSGCTYLSNNTILIAPDLVNPNSFPGFGMVKVPANEAHASNALYIGEGRVAMSSGYPRTRSKLVEVGYRPEELDLCEFWKGDGAVTCLSSPLFNNTF